MTQQEFKNLFENHFAQVRNYVFYRSGNADVATDIAQETFLKVWEKQKSYSIAITFGAIVNIILNLLLIPKYSYNGAALATLLSEVVVFIGVFYLFNKNLKGLLTQGG